MFVYDINKLYGNTEFY